MGWAGQWDGLVNGMGWSMGWAGQWDGLVNEIA